MNKKEFYSDKYKKIKDNISNLDQLSKRNFPRDSLEPISDLELKRLRVLVEDLTKQVHELNAGRNIFKDNDSQVAEEITNTEITEAELNEILKETKSGNIIKLTWKAVLFEFWCPIENDMVEKWIAKSLINLTVVIKTDGKGDCYHQVNKVDCSDLKEGHPAFLKVKEWKAKKLFSCSNFDEDDHDYDADYEDEWLHDEPSF